MSYFYRLAGENLELAKAELEGFLRSQGIEEDITGGGRIVETKSHPNQLKRLALTHEVVREIDIDIYRPEGSYAVRIENFSEDNFVEGIEEEVGSELSTESNEVDLESPDTLIKIYKTVEGLIYGEMVEEIPRGLFEDRTNEKRGFSSPVSMSPELARVLVNLSEASIGDKVLDPFCGTGGVLIEAGLCGMLPLGLDIQGEMVEGCKGNLRECGIINFGVFQADISEVDEIFNKYNVVISDLPYGKASKQENEPVEKFMEFIEGFDGKTVFMYNKASLGEHNADFEVYVHKSLTRYIYVI